MDLLTEAMTDCVMLSTDEMTEDSYGGYDPVYREGARFKAAFAKDNSLNAQEALAAGVTAIYTVATRKNTTLKPFDVFKRLSDNMVFRVQSHGIDSATPKSAWLDMRVVRAEVWKI